MISEHPCRSPGEYIVLTQRYLGLPVGSVGVITALSSSHPPCYLIYFGEGLPVGPFPDTTLIALRAASKEVDDTT